MEPLLKKYKVLIIGDACVGKTSLLLRHVEGRFIEEVTGTIGVDYRANTYVRDNQRYDLQIWDTAGQDRFKNVTRAYYRDANAALLVFDLTKETTLDNIKTWYQQLTNHVDRSDIVTILVGNKCDLKSKVMPPEIQQLASELNISTYVQTSAREGTRVNEVFEQLLEKLIAHDGLPQTNKGETVRLGGKPKSHNTCC